jgi:preprotein translocase subunit YajC
MHLHALNIVLADVTNGAPGQPGQPTGLQGLFAGPLLPIILMVVVVYFMLLRPQQQQRSRHAQLLKNLKSGDRVATASGIVGVVISVKDQTVSLRSADAKLEVTKASVTEILTGSDAES